MQTLSVIDSVRTFWTRCIKVSDNLVQVFQSLGVGMEEAKKLLLELQC